MMSIVSSEYFLGSIGNIMGLRQLARTDKRIKESSHENFAEYRRQPSSLVGRCLVPAGNQSASWKFHDWTDSVGSLWRYRGCFGHHPIVRGQPTAKRLDVDIFQAAFLPRLTLAHLARCAAAIFRRAEADIVRFLGTTAMPFTFAQRAF